MRAAEQWAQIEAGLADDWAEVRVAFAPEGELAQAAAVLAPAQPVRTGRELRFLVERRGGGVERVRNLLGRLDKKRVWGTLSVVGVKAAEARAVAVAAPPRETLAAAWDDAVSKLPPDWSDLLCELELDSSDHLPRAALLGAPMNPTRNMNAIALRFRASGKQGYGVSRAMARRSLERMDAEGITGTIAILHDLSDTENAITQGPVWRVAGRSV